MTQAFQMMAGISAVTAVNLKRTKPSILGVFAAVDLSLYFMEHMRTLTLNLLGTALILLKMTEDDHPQS
jgi:hypothetical protein